MRLIKRILVLIALFVSVSIVAEVNAATIKLNCNSKALYIGKSFELKLSGATDDIVWTSSDKTIATVEDGFVTAVSVGSAVITAAYKNNDYTCTITVKEPYISKTELSLYPEETFTLTLSGTKAKKWASSDKTVVTIEKGVVTAVGSGTATVTITGKNKKKYTCTVTVLDASAEKTFYKNGNVKSLSYYKAGKLIKYISLLKSGKTEYSLVYEYLQDGYIEYQYANNEIRRYKRVFDSADRLLREEEYRTSKKGDNTIETCENTRVTEFYIETGVAKSFSSYKYGVPSNRTEYDEDGKKRTTYQYYDDGTIYMERHYYENGRIKTRILYNKDGSISRKYECD